jgi:TrpR-related protein YerC/YecD
MRRKYPEPRDLELIKAIDACQNEEETTNFIRDVFTLNELKEAANRFQIAKLLWLGGKSYVEIAEECKTSTTTVTRVADWLYNRGYDGYQIVLERFYPKGETETEK